MTRLFRPGTNPHRDKLVMVFSGGDHDTGWPSEQLTKCVAWFTEKLDAIPQEYRDTAYIEIKHAPEEAVSGYANSHHAYMEIYYWISASLGEQGEDSDRPR